MSVSQNQPVLLSNEQTEAAPSAPVRVQLRRTKGWKMPPNTVKVDRSTHLGNPWAIKGAREAGYTGTDEQIAAWCVSLFREWLSGDERSLTRMLKDGEAKRQRILDTLPGLRGENLACWCAHDAPCHADVLLELANAPDAADTADRSDPPRETK